VWCGTETIGDRRAGLSEIKPGPARGELSSPSSVIHPGEDRPMSRRVAEQLSWFDAVQLRCAKETASNRVPCRGGTASFGCRGRCAKTGDRRAGRGGQTFETGYGNRLLVHHRCDPQISSGVDFEREVMG
jgi:hypothetical protein